MTRIKLCADVSDWLDWRAATDTQAGHGLTDLGPFADDATRRFGRWMLMPIHSVTLGRNPSLGLQGRLAQ